MTVGIVGLGLIGGSIGLALREPNRTVIGYDPSEQSRAAATSRGCIDGAASLEEVAGSDVVFIAVPPAALTATLDALALVKGKDTVLTDCTSVKADAVNWANRTKDPNFVIGHPMAGHENSGAAFASAWMFRGAKWIVCPLKHTASKAVKSVEALIKDMSATPVRMDPEQHDRQVAILSHLPHAVAGALVQLRPELKDEDVSGGSWRDLTRVGGVDPNLWTQIFMANRTEIARAIQQTEDKLSELKTALDANDEMAVKQFFIQARLAKSGKPAKI